MKRILIIIAFLIIFIFGFNKYQDYKRFNGPKTNYKANNSIDINYYNQHIVFEYQNAISSLNGFTKTQWSAHNIDVVNPKKDNSQTQQAVETYNKKLAQIKYYENKLIKSAQLKKDSFNNKDIRLFEENGVDLKTFQKNEAKKKYARIVLNSYNQKTIKLGEKNALVFELQKQLNTHGYPIKIDGVYKTETSDALKAFETKHNLLPDGKLDAISLEYLLENN